MSSAIVHKKSYLKEEFLVTDISPISMITEDELTSTP